MKTFFNSKVSAGSYSNIAILALVTQDCSFVAVVASMDLRVAMSRQSKDNVVVDTVEKLKRKYVENWKQVRVSTTFLLDKFSMSENFMTTVLYYEETNVHLYNLCY